MVGACTVLHRDDRVPKQGMYWQMDHHAKQKPGRTGYYLYTKSWKTIGMA